MQAKRILIITNRVPYPLNDGGNLAMHAMIYGYKNEGWQVCLLAMNTFRHYIVPQKLKEIYQDIDCFETVDIDNYVKVLPTVKNFLFSRQPNHVQRFYHLSFADKIKEVIASFNPDVIQVESIYLSAYLPEIRQQTKAFTILRQHNVEHEIWKRMADAVKSPLKKFYLNNLAKRLKQYEETVWEQYDMLLAITPQDAAIAKKFASNVIVVPFGIEYAPIADDTIENWNIYHIGAMDWLPNNTAVTWFLEKVWPDVYKKYREMEFFFAGRKMPRHLIATEIDGARCMGEVPDANAFIADKRILIVPIRSGGGIRVKILEAMAAGKIIISTDVGMQGIEAIPDVHYIRANTKKEFVAAIDRCMQNKEWAEQMGRNATELVKNSYDNRVIIQHLMSSIEQHLPAIQPINQ
jgi:glycosyltransferase involved in cell wall biosynthesis